MADYISVDPNIAIGVKFTMDSNGVEYMQTADGVYTSVAKPLDEPKFDYVLKAGDEMTGTLKSPRFVGTML